MKDYSMNLEERKDFILGYDITSDDMIKIKFAKGKPWYVPYNQENEKKILDKMEEQLKNASEKENKIKSSLIKNVIACSIFLGLSLSSFVWLIPGGDIQVLLTFSLLFAGAGLVPGISAIKEKIKLNDLRKNIRFVEIEEKLNKVVRTNQNTLVNVSYRTRDVIGNAFPEKPVFNINSFNYVPFSDLEKIMENVDRNERFGFDYSKQEEPHKSIVRKKAR